MFEDDFEDGTLNSWNVDSSGIQLRGGTTLEGDYFGEMDADSDSINAKGRSSTKTQPPIYEFIVRPQALTGDGTDDEFGVTVQESGSFNYMLRFQIRGDGSVFYDFNSIGYTLSEFTNHQFRCELDHSTGDVDIYIDGNFVSTQSFDNGNSFDQMSLSLATDLTGNRMIVYVDSFTPIFPPAQPTLSLDSVTSGQVDLSWTTDPDNVGYNVYRAESTGSSVGGYSLIHETTGSSYTDTGLEDGERYFYVVTGENSTGTESDISNEVNGTTPLPATDTPTLDASTEDQISLSWTKNDNSTDGNVEVLRSEDGTTGVVIATLAAGATSFTDSPLEDGERFYYTLRRSTDHRSDTGGQADAITVLPSLSGLGLVAASREVTVSWTVNDDSVDGDILVELKPVGGSWTTVATLDDDATTYTEPGLLDGERYRARVTRRTDHTDDGGSTTNAATTPLPAPTNLTIANVDADSGDLSWSATHNYGDTRVQLKPVGGSWSTVATVSRTTESYTLSMLRNGEQYRSRVQARTEHTTTTDQ